jgi:hypothetical protein
VPATPIAGSRSASLLRTCKQSMNEQNLLYAQSALCAVAHLRDRLGWIPSRAALHIEGLCSLGRWRTDLEPKQAHRLVRTDLTERWQLDRYAIRRGCAASNNEGERKVAQLQPGNRSESLHSD